MSETPNDNDVELGSRGFDRYRFVLVAMVLLVMVIIVLVQAILDATGEEEWTLSDLENYLENVYGAEIPDGATVISYDYVGGRLGGHVELYFSVPAERAPAFTDAICDGVLYQGYNPFAALDTIEPVANSHLIKMAGFTYYSYSPYAPDTIWGNRCNPGLQQIVVDKTNPDLNKIRFFVPGAACMDTRFVCSELGINYINPIVRFEFLIVGLHLIDDEYVLVHDEICFDTLSSYTGNFPDDSRFDSGTKLHIAVDDHRLPPGIVSIEGRLVPETAVSENLYSDGSYWRYCTLQDWQTGPHTINVEATSPDGTVSSFSWEFLVE